MWCVKTKRWSTRNCPCSVILALKNVTLTKKKYALDSAHCFFSVFYATGIRMKFRGDFIPTRTFFSTQHGIARHYSKISLEQQIHVTIQSRTENAHAHKTLRIWVHSSKRNNIYFRYLEKECFFESYMRKNYSICALKILLI